MAGEHLLEINNISTTVGVRAILDNVCLYVDAGEVVGILGRNGSGKTTLLRTVIGTVQITTGEIRIGGELLSTLPANVRASKGVGSMLEDMSGLLGMTTEDALLYDCGQVPYEGSDLRRRVRELLGEIGLFPQKGKKIEDLSAGQARCLGICRSMIFRPRLLLLDEPLSGIDPREHSELMKVIRKLPSHGASVLFTDHNVIQALEIFDRAYALDKGRIIYGGSESDVRRMVSELPG